MYNIILFLLDIGILSNNFTMGKSMNSKELLTKASFFQSLAVNKLGQTTQSLPPSQHAVPGTPDKSMQADPVSEAIKALIAPYGYSLVGGVGRKIDSTHYEVKIQMGDKAGPPHTFKFLTDELHKSGKLPADCSVVGTLQS